MQQQLNSAAKHLNAMHCKYMHGKASHLGSFDQGSAAGHSLLLCLPNRYTYTCTHFTYTIPSQSLHSIYAVFTLYLHCTHTVSTVYHIQYLHYLHLYLYLHCNYTMPTLHLYGTYTVPVPTVQVYTLNTETWKWTEHTSEIEGEAPSPRYGHAAVALPDGRHLATFGGCDQADHMFFSSIALLDTVTWRWTTPKIQASL